MKKLIITLVTSTCFYHSNAQSTYDSLISLAIDQYQNKAFCAAAATYNNAFYANGDRGLVDDRIAAAGCWVKCGKPDSSFAQLNKIVTRVKYTDDYALTSNSDLNQLHTDKRWNALLQQVKENKQAAFKVLKYPALAAKLDSMFNTDQQYRVQIRQLEVFGTTDSSQFKSIWHQMDITDSTNLVTVQNIIANHGWLGKEDIGDRGVLTMFLVIQHAGDLQVQLKYLPMLRQAAKDGKLERWNLAILEDRVLVRQGKKQLYGSQIGTDQKTGKHYILPIENEAQVNERRAEAGLQPLEIYAKNWGIEYKLPTN